MVVPEKFFEVEFGKAMAFGYRTEDVDEFVTKAIEIIKGLQAENQELTEKMGVLAQSLEKYREDEESLRSALIGAQKLGDSILKDSRSKAEVILREATTNADHIVEEAHARLDREKAEYERLRAEVTTFREGLFDMYKSHIDQISRLPHNDKNGAQRAAAQKKQQAPAAAPAPAQAAAPEPAPAPPPPPPKKVPEPPAPAPEVEEPEEEYVPAPPPPPAPAKRAPVKRPALRLELEDDEDEDEEDDDAILARFSSRMSSRRNPRPEPTEDDFDDDEEDDLPPSRTVFSSKFGEMRFGEGFSLTQDERDRERERERDRDRDRDRDRNGAGSRTGGRRR